MNELLESRKTVLANIYSKSVSRNLSIKNTKTISIKYTNICVFFSDFAKTFGPKGSNPLLLLIGLNNLPSFYKIFILLKNLLTRSTFFLGWAAKEELIIKG